MKYQKGPGEITLLLDFPAFCFLNGPPMTLTPNNVGNRQGFCSSFFKRVGKIRKSLKYSTNLWTFHFYAFHSLTSTATLIYSQSSGDLQTVLAEPAFPSGLKEGRGAHRRHRRRKTDWKVSGCQSQRDAGSLPTASLRNVFLNLLHSRVSSSID